MAQTRFEYLFERCIGESATSEEQEELMRLLQEPQQEAEARGLIQQALQADRSYRLSGESSNAVLQAIFQAKDTGNKPVPVIAGSNRRSWIRYAAAAALLFAVAGFWLWLGNKPITPMANRVSALVNDVAPGGNKAKLTLADGTVIILDSADDGALTHQGATAIIKKKNGQLVYDASKVVAVKDARLVFNTISTPRGGQYQVILPDGTKVWLNAASSLHFPTVFSEVERRVDLIGEAYFEVSKNTTSPFYILTENQEVTVLGTSFNIMGYADEHVIKTTLLDGSVKVRDFFSQNMQLLQPGQQSQLSYGQGGRINVNKDADTEEAVAWKNGKFQFESADIKTILRQVARWYDIDVVYEGVASTEKFTGEIPRSSNMMEVFKILKLSNVHFKIEGHTLTVMP